MTDAQIVLMIVSLALAMGGAVVYALRLVVGLLAKVLGRHLVQVEQTFDRRAGELATAIAAQATAAQAQAKSLDQLVTEVGAIRVAMADDGMAEPVVLLERVEGAALPPPAPPLPGPPPATSIPGPEVRFGAAGRRR